MRSAALDVFHEVSRSVDFTKPMEGLLVEFRSGNIADPKRTAEAESVELHLGGLYKTWDTVFPQFPDQPWRRRTITWEHYRGQRDAYLRSLICDSVPQVETQSRIIVNPATVFGRHARYLAHALPSYQVIGSDFDPTWNRLYRFVSPLLNGSLANYSFVRENIYKPNLDRKPAAVTFFGACGSVSDGCMDYALETQSPFLICRTCCHENIGGNTDIVRRPGPLNVFFRFKNHAFARYKRKNSGFYFSDKYDRNAYPRSKIARELFDTDTIIEIAHNSVDSDVCRSLIDLDRCLYLKENGYDVLYRDELFFAHLV